MLDTIPNTHSSSKIAEHFLDSITTRLQQSALMPELEMILHRLITEDSQAVYHEQRYTAVWDTLVISCNLSEHQIGPLRAAWLAFYLAACHLDHMQDNDPIASVLEELPLSSQYTIVLAYYVLASSLLDNLDMSVVPAHRIIRLHRLWSDSVLRIAGGQHSDLSNLTPIQPSLQTIEAYQEIVHAKAGTFYALAFAAAAALASDDTKWIAAMLTLGGLFGDLVQYQDDLLDHTKQTNNTITLNSVIPIVTDASNQNSKLHIWLSIRQSYIRSASSILNAIQPQASGSLLHLFTSTFGE